MSQIKPYHLIISLALSLALAGCGEKNDKAVFSSEEGHAPNWTFTHKTTAKADLESCTECHGANLDGGIAQVSCSLCHLGGSGSVHPQQWGNYAYARHKGFSSDALTASCATAVCHGTAREGVAGSGPACATACHLGGAYQKHPAGWTTLAGHKNYLNTIANVSTSCKTAVCHGSAGKGVFLSGPACDQCHSMK